jgi:hypothetical protein
MKAGKEKTPDEVVVSRVPEEISQRLFAGGVAAPQGD